MTDPAPIPIKALAARDTEIRRFVRARYGLRGTLALHREALGLDLLRAPLNVALAPLFLLVRLSGGLLSAIGARRAGRWLGTRQVFLKSDVARRIEADLNEFVLALSNDGPGTPAPPETIRHEVATLAETRNAVSEITTSLIVLLSGLLLFQRATPGVISLAGPIAEMRAHAEAVRDFTLGSGAGRLWYGLFPVELSLWRVIATGAALAVAGSLITAFAGLIADPVQVLTGTHRRRLIRLFNRLDNARQPGGIAREHLMARMGDLSDAVLGLWRALRG
ncbi:DUF6635 family protein [Paracoccus sp. (in: a-proteobacteria)]|uniref:DUF6635 family protein n=1 Tax=Paracoccus sp. TaxID=267 RepID=UPI003A8C73E7